MQIRFDIFIAKKYNISRNLAQKQIKDGIHLINNKQVKSNCLFNNNQDQYTFCENIPQVENKITYDFLNHLFFKNFIINQFVVIDETDAYFTIIKPHGLLSHYSNIENNSLLDYFQWQNNMLILAPSSIEHHKNILNNNYPLLFLKGYPLVHRLDKVAGGLMIIPKNHNSYLNLIESLKKKLNREYQMICEGWPKEQVFHKISLIEGKEAITHFEVIEKIEILGYKFSKITAIAYTGRNHQIRKHISSIGFPIIGDREYKSKFPLNNYIFLLSSKIMNYSINEIPKYSNS